MTEPRREGIVHVSYNIRREKLLPPFSGSSVVRHLTTMNRMNCSGVVLSEGA